jgi:hypothetical protein
MNKAQGRQQRALERLKSHMKTTHSETERHSKEIKILEDKLSGVSSEK